METESKSFDALAGDTSIEMARTNAVLLIIERYYFLSLQVRSLQGRHRALVEVPRSVNPDETEVVVRVLSDYLGSQVLESKDCLESPPCTMY